MGDFTTKLSAEQFGSLQDRSQRGELQYLKEVDGYFDDREHFELIRLLCSFTHPIFEKDGGPAQVFGSLEALKSAVSKQFKLSFCELCLKGRQAFICEQILYSKQQLEQHNKRGDETGPLAENGFKGHPFCEFCRERFYDRNDLYRHMESRHEHCFICRRTNPTRYVYYRHYDELQDHYAKDHQLCPHPACLERKFVVFATEAELKRHFAAEHGDEQKMSQAQRRAAMAISLPLQYRSGRGGPPPPQEAPQEEQRFAAVFGGGGNVPTRHGRRGVRGADVRQGLMRHIRSDPAMNTALQASVESAQLETAVRESAAAAGSDNDGQVSEVTFTAEDFPAVSRQGLSAVTAGRWAGGSAALGPLNQEDFPALPGVSKAAKRRNKEKASARSIYQQLAAAGRPIRIVNRGRPKAAAAGPSGSAGQPPPQALPVEEVDDDDDDDDSDDEGSSSGDDQTTLGAGPSTSAAGMAARLNRQPRQASPPVSTEAFPALSGGASAARPRDALSSIAQDYALLARKRGQGGSRSSTGAVQQTASPGGALDLRPEEYPSLSGPSTSARTPPPPALAAAAQPVAARLAATPVAAAAAQPAAPAAPVLRQEEFPTLATLAISTRAAPKSTAAPAAAAAAASAGPAVAAMPGGVSESLKAANKALIEKIRRQLDDEVSFSQFKQQSGAFMRGELGAEEYHEAVVDLGLLALAAELASICPDADRRAELMAAHKAYLASPAAQDFRALGSGWVPPEAALAAAARAEQQASWLCPLCTLINGPTAARCEACFTPRPQQTAAAAAAAAAAPPVPPPVAAYTPPVAAASAGISAAATVSTPPRPAAAVRPPPAPVSPPSASAEAFPPLPGGPAAGPSQVDSPEDGSGAAGKGKKPAKKQSMQSFLETQRVHPQNVWTQNRPAPTAADFPPPPAVAAAIAAAPKGQGQWGKQGGTKIAKAVLETNSAWAKAKNPNQR